MVAYLTERGSWLAIGVVFIICFGVIEGGVVFFLRQRLRRMRQEEEEFRRSLDSIILRSTKLVTYIPSALSAALTEPARAAAVVWTY